MPTHSIKFIIAMKALRKIDWQVCDAGARLTEVNFALIILTLSLLAAWRKIKCQHHLSDLSAPDLAETAIGNNIRVRVWYSM
jgi:hypothetical protein